MSKKKNSKPKHDEVIRAAFENPIVTQEFFETYLPPHIKTLLSFETLRMEKDSFVERSGNPPQKQSTRRVEFSNNKKGDSINDNIKTQ